MIRAPFPALCLRDAPAGSALPFSTLADPGLAPFDASPFILVLFPFGGPDCAPDAGVPLPRCGSLPELPGRFFALPFRFVFAAAFTVRIEAASWPGLPLTGRTAPVDGACAAADFGPARPIAAEFDLGLSVDGAFAEDATVWPFVLPLRFWAAGAPAVRVASADLPTDREEFLDPVLAAAVALDLGLASLWGGMEPQSLESPAQRYAHISARVDLDAAI